MLCSSWIKSFLVSTGSSLCLHIGEVRDGVDMRAEVGFLTWNTLMQWEKEDSCYGQYECHFFSFDTPPLESTLKWVIFTTIACRWFQIVPFLVPFLMQRYKASNYHCVWGKVYLSMKKGKNCQQKACFLKKILKKICLQKHPLVGDTLWGDSLAALLSVGPCEFSSWDVSEWFLQSKPALRNPGSEQCWVSPCCALPPLCCLTCSGWRCNLAVPGVFVKLLLCQAVQTGAVQVWAKITRR